MQNFIVIREFKRSDELSIREVVKNAIMSNVSRAFMSCLFREITFQLIVLCAALLFIFVGVPLMFCVITIPAVIAFNYVCIYLAHFNKAMETSVTRYPKTWVAEAFDPLFSTRNPAAVHYVVLNEKELTLRDVDLSNLQSKVVGTISVQTHNSLHNANWMCRLAISESYKNKGIAHALVRSVIEYCQFERVDKVEVTVTECQEKARQMFINLGFTIRQIYHKQIIGSALTVLKYQLGFDTMNF